MVGGSRMRQSMRRGKGTASVFHGFVLIEHDLGVENSMEGEVTGILGGDKRQK